MAETIEQAVGIRLLPLATELLDVAGRPLRTGDCVVYVRNGGQLGYGKVVEVRRSDRPFHGYEFDLRVQGVRRISSTTMRLQRPAWLQHLRDRILRLEPCQIPDQASELLGGPTAYPLKLADLEAEQQALTARLIAIDVEMEHCHG